MLRSKTPEPVVGVRTVEPVPAGFGQIQEVCVVTLTYPACLRTPCKLFCCEGPQGLQITKPDLSISLLLHHQGPLSELHQVGEEVVSIAHPLRVFLSPPASKH